MRLKYQVLGLMLLGLLTVLPATSLAEDGVKLRIIEGRETKAKPKAKSKRNSNKTAAKTEAAETPIRTLESGGKSSILPEPLKPSADLKGSLAQRVQKILSEKALFKARVGIEILDLDSGEIFYSHHADRALKPASNTKLVTTAAALALLGSEHQFESSLSSKARIEKGVLKGDLHLHIGHDFTWSTRFYNSGDIPMHGLIQQLEQQGIKRIEGKLRVSGYVVYGGTPTGTLSCSAHLQAVSRQFSAIMKRKNISFQGLTLNVEAKPEGKKLALWHSPVLSEAIVPINRASHNEYADMLLLAIGAEREGKSSFEAGVKAILAWLKAEKIPHQGFIMKDGSGLSHDNRMSPNFFNALTAHILKSAYAREWAASMSISGYDGTYGGRLMNDDSKGRVYAKSGTLRDTISGSGFFVNRYDGHSYAFSILVNEMRNKRETRIAIDRIVRIFMGDHFNVQRPDSPVLESFLRSSGKTEGALLSWNEVKGAVGYRIYGSQGQSTWTLIAETKENQQRFDEKAYDLRVTAVSATGAESEPSRIFSYRPGKRYFSIVERAKCRPDSEMRPDNLQFSHERALSHFIDKSWGVETVRTPSRLNAAESSGVLWHDVACAGRLSSDPKEFVELMQAKIPLIVNIADAHLLDRKTAECKPQTGQITGCFGEAVISMDRRLGKLSNNLRLRKAAGSGSTRPSQIKTWNGAKSCVDMAGSCVAACEKNAGLSLIGFDLQAVDCQKSLDLLWTALMAE